MSLPRPDTRALRILHVTPSYAPCVGGAERLTQAVSERLAARGHEVTVLTTDCATQRDFASDTGAGLPALERMNGVTVRRVSPAGGLVRRAHEWMLRRRGGHRATQWLLGPDYEFHVGRPSGLAMIGPLLRIPADVVATVNWHYGLAYWTTQALRLRRTPHVAVPVLHIDRPWAHRAVYHRLLRRCDAAILLTEAEAEFVRARGVADTTVAGGGVDPARFERRDGGAVRARYGLGSRPVVGFLGRQDTNKGVPTLIRAMRAVWLRNPGAILLMAGQRTHRDEAVTAALGALSPEERQRVVLIDDFPDPDGPSILDACDVVAQPSVEEAFGLVLLEAWMCGKPVIGADIAATRTIIEPGVDGWLVKPFDPDDLADRLQALLADPDKRSAFGRRGREKVLARFTWERIVDAWEATYRSVVSRRR